ncbi:competence/damage-inducible protein CinA C-terminal domain [Ehrlichia chaffeensis str. Arkansas]|uniref:Competence/damage-inducible protein CinA C-terminal domain n=1 Tax=Ehrlichia chaffeensis (strain ATCC CRL-10679 / Arkansas) TaxID=205920 RepID=Q2GI93_EHRCR|nr:CinA family protein [Ehrlichia chaffeensis]ABD45156.1 competence/damage-inducible protein CinA C-terminal domain [Ehrlichia chaffeensis str. Arkansas]AHX09039.1 competence/damage-inducible CinA C-terminal domain protein [Ehrlichia chaffeensis str. Wakulla]
MIIEQEILKKAETCVSKLIENNSKIVIAESCTAGLMSFLFSCIPGASKVLDSSFVVYSDESKAKFLNIDKDLISKYGAVSSEVSVLMAVGVLENSKANVSVSITGFAGPRVGDEQVGLVYIGYASNIERDCKKYYFSDMNRCKVQMSSASAAMDFLLHKMK